MLGAELPFDVPVAWLGIAGVIVVCLMGYAMYTRWLGADDRRLDDDVRAAFRSGDYVRAGDIQARREMWLEAARLYERAESWARQGRALIKLGDSAGAAKAFEKAQEWEQAAKLYRAAGLHDAAAECGARSQDPASQHAAAMTLARKGDHARAAELFRKCGKVKEAAECYLKLPKVEPVDMVVTMLEAEALKFEGAAKAPLLKLAGEAALKLGQYERAARAFDGAGALDQAARVYEQALHRHDVAAAIYTELGHAENAARNRTVAGDAAVLRAREARARQQGQGRLAEDLRSALKATELGVGPAAPVASVPPAPTAGEGRYVIVGELGRGGMGVVYRAKDRTLGREVALKFLPDDIAPGSPVADFFRREGRAAAQLAHPGIVTIFDVGVLDGREFIAMELVDGTPLDAHLATRHHLGVLEFLEVAAPAAAALAYAHSQGIVHRDIKPANLMLLRAGGVKIMDFGLAKSMQASAAQKSTIVAGTPAYMPPEQYKGKAERPADVFALGASLYEMLTGQLPGSTNETAAFAVGYPTPRDRVPAIPEKLSQGIMACLAHDPSQRPDAAALSRFFEAQRRQITDALHGLNPDSDEAWIGENSEPRSQETKLGKASERKLARSSQDGLEGERESRSPRPKRVPIAEDVVRLKRR